MFQKRIGFSKLSKQEKIAFLADQLNDETLGEDLRSYDHPVNQKRFDEFSENTLANYYLPYGVAPNFLINGELLHVPMVVEESSVVAAASSAAKFWANHGGFQAEIVSAIKTGQVHFIFEGNANVLCEHWSLLKDRLLENCEPLVINMKKRGGGICDLTLQDGTGDIPGYYQLNVSFETEDSMGANFINSVLENMAGTLQEYCSSYLFDHGFCEIIMSILSNYTPQCLVKCKVEAPISVFESMDETLSSFRFVDRFAMAVKIAGRDMYRAVTHNKGLMNGIDAVVLASGNDFRAVEADIHAYAARRGKYQSLSELSLDNGFFSFSIEVPLNIGVVGGLTTSHPLAARTLQLLGNPNSKQLMMIAASVGLACHFAAIRALITKGIQRGHMKMHLTNMLYQLNSSEAERSAALHYFSDRLVSYSEIRSFLEQMRR
jgi:hydroxymethylglutaryl-CoA reductase